MKQSLLLTLSLTVAVAMSSCSSMQLVPGDFRATDPTSTALGLRASGKVIYLEHLPDDSQQFVFDLEIINESKHSYMVDPSRLRLYASQRPFPNTEVENRTEQAVSHVKQYGGIPTVKPRSAKEVNEFFERKIRAQRAWQVAMLVAGTALVVSDVVQDVNDSKKEIFTQKDINRAIMRDVATGSALVAMDMASGQMDGNIAKRAEDLEFLPDEYLGAQLLLEGSSARGKVFFPKKPATQAYTYYRIIMPVDGAAHIFDFRMPKASERRAMRHAHD